MLVSTTVDHELHNMRFQTKSVFLKDYVRQRNKYTWTVQDSLHATKALDFAIHVFANERVGCKVWVNLKELHVRHIKISAMFVGLFLVSLELTWLWVS